MIIIDGQIFQTGYWVNESDPVTATIDMDKRELYDMACQVPSRFSSLGEDKYDEDIHSQCLEIGKSQEIVDGWDMTWLESLAQVNLDDLAAQIIGSCVATSHITLLATRMLHQIMMLGNAEELLGRKLSGRDSVCPFGPYSYRAGRRFAGINGRSDGSTCAGQIKGTMEFGFLPCDTSEIESDFFPEPKSTSTYRSWGSNDSLLNKFAATAKQYDLIESVSITSVDQAIASLKTFKPLQICSGWGFKATSKKLPNGDVLSRRSGSWAHSMQVQGIVKMSDGNWYVKIRNQWGNAHAGKNYFWVTIDEFEKWLRSSSTMSIGQIKQRDSNAVSVWSIEA